MTTQTNVATPNKPLRLWPGVVIVALQWLVWLVVPIVVPGAAMTALLAAVALGLVVVVWWLLFSRAPWAERVGAIVLMAAAVVATKSVVHASVATAGMGRLIFIFAIPVMSLALVAWAAASRRLSTGPRRAALIAAILLACGVFTLVRTAGVTGDGTPQFHWRWTPTPEERLLAQAGEQPALLPSPPAATTAVESPAARVGEGRAAAASAPPAVKEKPREASDASAAPAPAPARAAIGADWPGFRGPARDGVVPGVRIATDWAKSPPVELWRRPIGPGWSSFAVRGDRVYTQEQRGEDEIVSCYNLTTGQPVWRHADAARFWVSEGGPGPRATPALSNGRVYTLGATGILNALDAGSGAVVWSRNAATDTGAPNPGWGFAGSPLVLGGDVIVAASGRLAAYDAATGHQRWLGPANGTGYSSPHPATIDGVPQILLLRGSRSTSVAPADGTLLWEHVGEPGVSIVQPALAPDGNV
jgi:outer membrane protein assembly factor BamB